MTRPMTRAGRHRLWVSLSFLLVAPLARPALAVDSDPAFDFRNVAARATEFMGYDRSITLTSGQREVKGRALSAIPAPCCKDYAIRTCCCPCNLARSVWGLARYAIAKRGYGEAQVKGAVQEWLRAVNTSGFSGSACHRGRCGRPFAADGCGGMDEGRLVF